MSRMEKVTRLVAQVSDPSYDPDGRYYGRDSDPFLYRITETWEISNRNSGRLLYYRLRGIPVALREDWREQAKKKGEVVFARVLSKTCNPDALYENSEDPDDPYVYRPTQLMEYRQFGRVWYEFSGVAVDVKRQWHDVINSAAATYAEYEQQKAAESKWNAYQSQRGRHSRQSGQNSSQGRSSSGVRGRSPHANQSVGELRIILGVSPRATKQEVKVAYRRLVREYHPDVNKAPGAQDRFLLIQEAYERLIIIAL